MPQKYEKIPLKEFGTESSDESDGERDTHASKDSHYARKDRLWETRNRKTSSACCPQSKDKQVLKTIVLALMGAIIAFMFVGVAIKLSMTSKKKIEPPPTPSFVERNLLDRYCSASHISIASQLLKSSNNSERMTSKILWKIDAKQSASSESSVRFVDVNCDGVLDAIVAYEIDEPNVKTRTPRLLVECLSADAGTLDFCHGGVLALDGQTGAILWERMTPNGLYAIACLVDVTGDGDTDCFVGGRYGDFAVLERHTGAAIWSSRTRHPTWGYSTPQLVRDYDGDGVGDVVVTHGGDPACDWNETERDAGLLLLYSSRRGVVLSAVAMPDGRETYMSPVVHDSRIYFGSGGETVGGCLWSIDADRFAALRANGSIVPRVATKVFESSKGVMNPPVFADLTGDGIDDVVLALFNGRLVVLDGRDHAKLIWSVDFGMTETYSQPAIGRYNDDDVPDVMVIYHYGTYHEHYTKTTIAIVDGKSGRVLMKQTSSVTTDVESSPLVIKTTKGPDVFLYWRKTSSDDNEKEETTGRIMAQLLAISETNRTLFKDLPVSSSNALDLSSTPGSTDMDGNGKLDLVASYSTTQCISPDDGAACENAVQLLHVFRVEIELDDARPLTAQAWLGYMGTRGDGHNDNGAHSFM